MMILTMAVFHSLYELHCGALDVDIVKHVQRVHNKSTTKILECTKGTSGRMATSYSPLQRDTSEGRLWSTLRKRYEVDMGGIVILRFGHAFDIFLHFWGPRKFQALPE